MDSGNSGSMQSSSTGGGDHHNDDQEYESRSDSLSPFFNPFGAFENAQSLQFSSLTKFNNGFPLIFDQQTPNSFAALDTNFFPINSNNLNNWANKSHPIISSQPEKELQVQERRPDGPRNGPGRNPKKRSRASRRAPTTVLTTDTSNFRQMVQEFTGIPAPPFSSPSSSSFPTTRLDLFGFGFGPGSGSRLVDPQKMAPNHHHPTSGGNFLSFQSLLQRPSSSSLNNLGLGHVISANNVGGNYSGATNVNSLENNSNNGSINLRVEGGMLDNSWICSSD